MVCHCLVSIAPFVVEARVENRHVKVMGTTSKLPERQPERQPERSLENLTY